MKKTKQVLFAHQSTIPHYRVEFYNCLQKLKPDTWDFTVVFDKKESESYFFKETDDFGFSFNTQNTKTYNIKLLKRKLKLQTFPLKSFRYDLIIVGSALDNLTYPIVFLFKVFGKKVSLWGKGKDYEAEHKDLAENISERFKIFLSRKASYFFAYTKGVKQFLISKGVKENKIIAIENTIDIFKQRDCFEKLIQHRNKLREKYNLSDRKVLLFVGRLIKNKRIDFILEAFDALYASDHSYKLIFAGSGEKEVIDSIKERYPGNEAECHGFVPDDVIGEYYTFSDLFIFPGVVGLGPLQSLCYDLTPVLIDSAFHSPEYEYMNDDNALILPNSTTPQEYAAAIKNLLDNPQRVQQFRQKAFESVKHLTLENMARNFIMGINVTLSK